MSISPEANLPKNSKERLRQALEIQRCLYSLNYEQLKTSFLFIAQNDYFMDDNDLLFLVKSILYGCEIRPIQIAIFAHFCTLINYANRTIKTNKFINFKSIMKKVILEKLDSYCTTLFLYELITDGFFANLNEIMDEVEKRIIDINFYFEKYKYLFLFFGPEMQTEYKDVSKQFLSEFSHASLLRISEVSLFNFIRQSKFENSPNSEKNKNDFFQRRVNGDQTDLFNAVAVDNVDYLKQNIRKIMNRGIPERAFFRFDFLNASCSFLMVAAYFDSINCFEFLYGKKIGVGQKDSRGENFFSAAAAGGSEKVIAYILSNKLSNPSVKVLSAAVRNHRYDVFNELVKFVKSDSDLYKLLSVSIASHNLYCFMELSMNSDIVKGLNDRHQNILMLAAREGIVDLVGFLVENYSFDMKQLDSNKKSLVGYSIESRNLPTVKLVLSHFKPNDPFLKDEVFRQENSFSTSFSFQRNGNVFYDEVKYLTPEVLDFLLKYSGLDVNMIFRFDAGNSLLHKACEFHNVDLVRFILDQKTADVNVINNDLRSPIFVAVIRKFYEIVEMFLNDKRVNFSLKDHSDSSLLHYAVREAPQEIVKKIFKKNPFAIFESNNSYNTPLDYAIGQRNRNIIQILTCGNND